MSENIINIEIKGKSTPVVNITITDSVNISESISVNPVIKYIATGGIGPTGSTGSTGSVSNSDSVTQANMAANSIGTPEIIDNSITHNKIANNAVYGNNILDNSLAGSKLLNNSIDGSKIQNDSIDASKIANGAITTELLEAGLISADQIRSKSIFGGQIANNTLVREHHVDNSIDGSVIEDNVNLVGTVTVNHLELEGSSPALIEGPSADDINIKTHNQLNIHNTSGSAIASFDQSGNLSLSGTVDGINIATDVAANTLKTGITPSQSVDITNNTAKLTNTVTNLSSIASSNSFTITSSDGQNASLSAATQSNWGVMTNDHVNAVIANTAKADLTVDGAGTVHANNYTDTNTTYSIQDGELSQNNFTDADHTKLNNIEANATADQTKADIDALGIAATTAVSLTAGNKTIDGDLDIGSNQAGHDLNLYGANLNNAIAGWVSSANVFKFTDSTKLGFGTANQPGAVDSSIQANGSNLVITNTVGNIQIGDTVEITGNLTTTGDIELGHATDTTLARSAAGTVTIAGKEIITKNKVLNIHSYAYHYSSAAGHYIPMSGATTSDSTGITSSSYHLMQVMPFDGRVVRIAVYNQSATSRTDKFEMYIDGDDSNLVTDQRGTDLSFTSARTGSGDCATDWTFSKEEAIAIRRTPSAAVNGTTVTVVFEFDMTT